MATRMIDTATGTDDWPSAARDYVAAVEEALGPVDEEERGDLVEDLRAHIAALLAEERDDVDLGERLGTPEAYAAELLDSAGLARSSSERRWARSWGQVGEQLRAYWSSPVTAWLAQLAPAWWVARGYGAAVFLASVGGGRPLSAQVPVPLVLGNPFTGLLVTAGLIYLSVEVGAGRLEASDGWRRRARWGVSLVASLTLLALAFAVAAASLTAVSLSHVVDPFAEEEFQTHLHGLEEDLRQGERVLTLPGMEPVTNIYPFDRDGQPLEDVLLYDGAGNPLVLQAVPDGRGYPFDVYGLETDYQRDVDGNVVPNLYPLEQYRTTAPRGPEGFEDPAAVDPAPLPPAEDGHRRPVPEVAVPPLGEDSGTQAPSGPTPAPAPSGEE